MITKYTVRKREDGVWGVYVAGLAVMVAEFKPGCNVDARSIGRVLDAAPELLAALETVEWTEVDPDLRPCYGRCPACKATTREWVDGRYKGTHEPDCKLYAALARARADSREEVEA